MTPLAARLANQLVLPAARRDPFWNYNVKNLRESLDDIHCFEVTEVLPLLPELKKTIEDRFGPAITYDQVKPEQSEFIGRLVFLPAPKTWIEWQYSDNDVWRVGLLIEEFKDLGRVTLFTEECATPLGTVSLVSDDWQILKGEVLVPKGIKEQLGDKLFSVFLTLGHCCLVLINSPKIIGRKQIMPHRGLERRLTKGLGVGKFPLHAWTELKLHVAKPVEIDDGEPHEAHLTGRRALHFVRKHIRIRLGRLEYVSAHWRGDPALGIKQTRYTVVA